MIRGGRGSCDDGDVLQERAGEAELLAAASDVAVLGLDGETELTAVEVGG